MLYSSKIIILILALAAGCSKYSKTSSTSLVIKNFMTEESEQKAVIHGISHKGDVFQLVVQKNENIRIEIPVGDWRFSGTFVLKENNRALCTYVERSLVKETSVVDLEYSERNCEHSYFNISHDSLPKIIACGEMSPSGEACSSPSLNAGSFEVISGDGEVNKVSQFNITQFEDISNCIQTTNGEFTFLNKFTTGVSFLSKYPLGIRFYSDTNCQSEVKSFEFESFFKTDRQDVFYSDQENSIFLIVESGAAESEEQEEENPVGYDSPYYEQCTNELKDGLETGVDCGEICQDLELGGLCSDHESCLTGNDCKSGFCDFDKRCATHSIKLFGFDQFIYFSHLDEIPANNPLTPGPTPYRPAIPFLSSLMPEEIPLLSQMLSPEISHELNEFSFNLWLKPDVSASSFVFFLSSIIR